MQNSKFNQDNLQSVKRFKSVTLCLDNQHNLNTVINFKVNNYLKSEFDRICKENHSNLSRELKVFMLNVVKQGHFNAALVTDITSTANQNRSK